jgi:hypothetical protein
MSIRFVATDPERGGLPVKRRQVATACAPCRKKKVCVYAPFLVAELLHPSFLAFRRPIDANWPTELLFLETLPSPGRPGAGRAAARPANIVSVPVFPIPVRFVL